MANTRTLLSGLFISISVLLAACSQNKTAYKIYDAIPLATKNEIRVLISKEQYLQRCRWGGHGCSSQTTLAELFYIDIPTTLTTYSPAKFSPLLHKIATSQEIEDFSKNSLGSDTLLTIKHRKDLVLCQISGDNCSNNTILTAPSNALENSEKYALARSGHYFLWHDKLYRLPTNSVLSDLSLSPIYQAFKARVQTEFSSLDGARIPHQLIDNQYIIALRRYTPANETLFALAFDLQKHSTLEIHRPTSVASTENKATKPKLALHASAAQQHNGELLFLVEEFAYEGFKKTVTQTSVFNNTTKIFSPIEPFEYTYSAPTWDTINRRFLLTKWRSGIQISEITY